MTTRKVVIDNTEYEVDFWYDDEDGYTLHNINAIDSTLFIEEFISDIIEQLEFERNVG